MGILSSAFGSTTAFHEKPDVVYRLLLIVAPQVQIVVMNSDPMSMSITFRAPSMTKAWDGTFSAVVIGRKKDSLVRYATPISLVNGSNLAAGNAVNARAALEMGMQKALRDYKKGKLVLVSAAQPVTNSAPLSTADEIAKYNELRLSGVLTDEEFATQKERLLG